MKYAKLKNGELIAAPNPLIGEGFKTYNPMEKLYRAAGYLPVEETPQPDDGGYYEPRWEQQGDKIVRVWEAAESPVVEAPEPLPDPTPAKLREQAYDNDTVIPWEGNYLTVTQAAKLWTYYAAEGNDDKAQALTDLIAQAKREIRERWPDEEVTV